MFQKMCIQFLPKRYFQLNINTRIDTKTLSFMRKDSHWVYTCSALMIETVCSSEMLKCNQNTKRRCYSRLWRREDTEVDTNQRFSPEDGDIIFLRNVDIYLLVYTASQPRRIISLSSPPWEPKISQNTTRRNNPEDHCLYSHRLENLKSYRNCVWEQEVTEENI
jgi:hypothetical protein